MNTPTRTITNSSRSWPSISSSRRLCCKNKDPQLYAMLREMFHQDTRTLLLGLSSNPAASIGRNDPCPCGSGKKYKHCCLLKGAAPAE